MVAPPINPLLQHDVMFFRLLGLLVSDGKLVDSAAPSCLPPGFVMIKD